MLACQILIDAGDEVVVITPVWPNLTAQPVVMGAVLRSVSLQPTASGAWQLDMAQLLSAVTSKTKMLILNAPNNPTGWTLSKAEQQTILQHCRSTGPGFWPTKCTSGCTMLATQSMAAHPAF